MAKRNIILILVLIIFSTLLNSQEVANYAEIATFNWQDQARQIFLSPGIYHFEFSGRITTDTPFDPTNLWLYCATIENISEYGQYDTACCPMSNGGVGDRSDDIRITDPGYYTIKAGIESIYACTVNTNQAVLIRTYQLPLK